MGPYLDVVFLFCDIFFKDSTMVNHHEKPPFGEDVLLFRSFLVLFISILYMQYICKSKLINGKLEYNSKDGFINGFPSVFFTAKYFLLLYCFFHRFYSGAHFVEENVVRFV